ncbi:MAG: HXXEE domain-containing protein [Calditrichaeota bacterium]|nr:HXXEE domain-containing protein [Calditrichota bacterium]MCB9369250.1 HXXEE domain-containing protein [Calditrichota bacterium]
MLHQLEEYVIPGGFLSWINKDVFGSDNPKSPITPVFAFVLNVVIAWPLYAAVGYVNLEQMWFVMPAMGILFVNAWFHIALSLTHSRYSPGTFSSIMLILPLTLYTFYYYIMTWEIGFRLLFISIVTGLVFHLLFLAIPRELIHAKEKRQERQPLSDPKE